MALTHAATVIKVVGFTAVPCTVEGLACFGAGGPVEVAGRFVIGVDLFRACPGARYVRIREHGTHDLHTGAVGGSGEVAALSCNSKAFGRRLGSIPSQRTTR